MEEFRLTINKPLDQRFMVADWVVDPQLNCLYEQGNSAMRISLEPRIMHLLCFLAANQGGVLSREQLTEELWPKVIVNENSLTRAVSELRKQLGLSTAAYTDCLETIPKKGYRLAPGSVKDQVSVTAAERSREPQATFFLTNVYHRLITVWQPLLAAGSISLVIAMTASHFAISNINPIATDADNLIADRVIEPEQKLIAGQLRLTVANSSNPATGALDSRTPTIAPPIISADGNTLAFISYQDNVSRIFLIPVHSIESPLPIFSSNDRLFNLSWSPLGDALLFASQPPAVTTTVMDKPGKTASLLMLDLESMELTVLINNHPQQPATADTVAINLT